MKYGEPDPDCPICEGQGVYVVSYSDDACDYDEFNCECIEVGE